MTNSLNLASRPFRNRGLPWTIAVLLSVVSVAALVFVLTKNAQVRRDLSAVKTDIDKIARDSKEIDAKNQQISDTLTPQQKNDWRAANQLVNRKRFPWSRLFVDLESALPSNVRVNRINIRDIAAIGNELISEFELVVQSRDTDTVTGMIDRMEAGGIFQADVVNQALLKGKNEIGTEWTLRVRYRPRAGVGAGNDTLAANNPTEGQR